jgi:hypothetical protein
LVPDKAVLAEPLLPLEAAIIISSGIIDDEPLSSLVATISTDRCFKIAARVAPERAKETVS